MFGWTGRRILRALIRLEERLEAMATREDLDAAIASIKSDVGTQADRLDAAIQALQDKIDALNVPQDFSAEIADLQGAQQALDQIGSAPASPPPSP